MAGAGGYRVDAPTREDVEATRGPLVLEFGTDWCGHCQAAQVPITRALGAREGIVHMKIEDGPGRPLGRSFRVKLWPTVVVLRDGVEVGRVVRPLDAADVEQALGALDASAG